jgi:thioesterase domain-containing protein/acyl carrier protein
LVIARPGGHRDPRYLANVITRENITTLHFVPSMLRSFLEAAEIPKRTSVRQIFCSGEALPADLQHQFFSRIDADLHNLYGPTEAAVDVTHWTCRRDDKRSFVPIGRPIANIEIYILDEQLQATPAGAEGELHIGGIGLARGYLNRPELTAEKFIRNPFSNDSKARLYKTGDLARFLPSGDIEYLGRLDYQVKIRGFRIELEEIEIVISRYPGIRQVVVVAREDTPGDKRLVAYVVPVQIEQFKTAGLQEFLKSQLPDYMVPVVIVLQAMPLSSNGKVDRKALPSPFENHREVHEFIAARNEIEKTLAGIWSDLLATQEIGIRDNFFELGGQSLLAAHLVSEVEKAFGRKIDLSTLLTSPTIEQLARHLQTKEATEHSSLVPIRPTGSKSPLFCVHGGGGHVLRFRAMAARLDPDQPFYGLRSPNVDGAVQKVTVEELAAGYIRDIRSVQSHGPYNLSGASFGGLVAYEMATQLVAQGDQVGVVALFDTGNPAYYRDLSFSQSMRFRASYLLERFQSYGKRLLHGESWELARDLGRSFYTRASRVAWNIFQRLYSVRERPMPGPLRDNVMMFTSVAQAYTPKPYPGRVTLFRAAGRTAEYGNDPALGWEEVVRGEIEIITVPGDHMTILEEPHVWKLVEQLSACLDTSRARRSPGKE